MAGFNSKNIIEAIRKILYNYLFLIITITAVLCLILRHIYRKMRRIVTIRNLPVNCRNIRIKGFVTHISDGDGFKFIHIPFLRKVEYKKGDPVLKLRLAGIDAPEVKCFSKPAQKYAYESKNMLKNLVYKKKVDITILCLDNYGRILGVVMCKNENGEWINVSIEMVKCGMACVYIGKNAKYGNFKDKLIGYEMEARKKKLGIWKDDDMITPMEYKKMYRAC